MGFWWNQGGKLHEPRLAVSALRITGAGDKLDVPRWDTQCGVVHLRHLLGGLKGG